MQTVRAIMLIFAGLIGVTLSILCFIALLPLLPFIRYLAGGCLAFGACYIMAVGVIDLRRRWLYSSVIPLAEYGAYHARRLEVLHIPQLALPAPSMTITEEKADGYSPGDLEILAMVSQGKSQEAVAKACNTNQTYVSRLVRRYKEQHNMD